MTAKCSQTTLSIALVLLATGTWSAVDSRNAVSPDGKLQVKLVVPATGSGYVVLASPSNLDTLATFPLNKAMRWTGSSEPRMTTVTLKNIHRAALRKVVWNTSNTAVAVQVDLGENDNPVIAFVRANSGDYKAFDAARFTGNLGKLGDPPNHWRRIENEPMEWHEHPSPSWPGSHFLTIRTRAWDHSGRRFTAEEHLFITASGEPVMR